MNAILKEVRRLEFLLTFSKRDNGETFWYCKDGINEEDYDLVRDFHGTDILPDDFRYETIVNLLDRLHEYEFESVDDLRNRDIDNEIIDSLVSIYNADLLNWLASNLNRADYCNEAVSIGLTDGTDIIKTIQAGQYLEISEILNRILGHLETLEIEFSLGV